MVETPLPALRQDLKLLPAAHDADGAPRWLLHDGVRNRYFSLSRPALDLIRHWMPGCTLEQMSTHLVAKGFDYEPEEIRAFSDFLTANHLVQARSAEAVAQLTRQHQSRQQGVGRWLLHNYLFVRIPLLRPDPWLARFAPCMDWIFHPLVQRLVLLLGGVGGLLVLRQWESFTTTFLYFFNLQGVLLYALTLVLVKSAHELGHALMCHRLGCRVASMGVAFLVLLPVLYTDTTDAWKLRSRRDRLRIVIAGVRTEIYLALIATFLWSVLPDGGLRSACFFVATTSWITSLLVNISPLLKFDGYYAFSDLIGVENLQYRSFALGRWQLRRWLWGLEDPLPEPLSRPRARLLTLYAWCTWLYRFFLFLGIALLVYHFFFKVLGLFLFVVEVAWFIVMPVFRELKVWRTRRAEFHFTPGRLLLWLLPGALLIWSLLPLPVDLSVPAVLRAERSQMLFATESAQVEQLHVESGAQVAAGTLLLKLKAPQLEYELAQTREQLALVETRLGRQSSSLQDRAEQAINQELARQLRAKQRGLQARQARLEIRAPFTGQITRRERLHVGQWVGEHQPLLTLIDPMRMRVEGFVAEQSLHLLSVGDQGFFVRDSGQGAALGVQVEQIDVGAVGALPYPELGSESGGALAVQRVEDRLIPQTALYRVSLRLTGSEPALGEPVRQPGMLLLQGRRQSWLWFQARRVLALVIRESGF